MSIQWRQRVGESWGIISEGLARFEGPQSEAWRAKAWVEFLRWEQRPLRASPPASSLEERCKLPQRGPRRSPGCPTVFLYFKCSRWLFLLVDQPGSGGLAYHPDLQGVIDTAAPLPMCPFRCFVMLVICLCHTGNEQWSIFPLYVKKTDERRYVALAGAVTTMKYDVDQIM